MRPPAGIGEVLVIGIGNPYRGDDGVGVVVARRLRELRLPEVVVREESGEGASLMDCWAGARRVVVVDAMQSGRPAGSVHRFDAREQAVPVGQFNYSTHAFSLAEAVEMARVLGGLPDRLVVYGIEGADFGAGEGLSAAVREVVAAVTERVVDEIRSLQSMNNPTGESPCTSST